jgi:hypothetical protein
MHPWIHAHLLPHWPLFVPPTASCSLPFFHCHLAWPACSAEFMSPETFKGWKGGSNQGMRVRFSSDGSLRILRGVVGPEAGCLAMRCHAMH